jgi:hypothetical protein
MVLSLVTAAACASKSATASGSSAAKSRRDPSVMDSSMLWYGNYGTVYDALTAQHSDWLLARGGPSGGRLPEVGVWLDASQRSRGVDFLKSVRPTDIRSVKRLSPTETLSSYNWPWGGLLIRSR